MSFLRAACEEDWLVALFGETCWEAAVGDPKSVAGEESMTAVLEQLCSL